MIEVVIKNLDNILVATVVTDSTGKCVINTNDNSIKEKIQEVINRATEVGIPLRSDSQQRLEQGIRYRRLARWLKPGDKDFLQALADDLSRHRLLAYTIEKSDQLSHSVN